MPLERRLSRSMFLGHQLVELRQLCLTAEGVFEPGQYLAKDLPDIAFTMGLVEALPPSPDQDPSAAGPTSS
ncbi:MAG: hypothetical protein VKO01_07340 [Cyanobacteriota bacterium]|jgi:hypothetical protein|nr:hypothetical protein [Cyanobacteriota bacterium]